VDFGGGQSLLHTQLLPFYLDEVGLDKEITLRTGVTVKKKKINVSYVMPTIAQRSTLLETSDVGPSVRKRTQKPTSSEDEPKEGEEEVFPSGTL
jgi:hypothetical protein